MAKQPDAPVFGRLAGSTLALADQGWSKPAMVDLVTAYSNRLDLAERLVRTVQRVRHVQSEAPNEPTSVRSTGRSERQWRVSDRLSQADVRLLVKAFESGTPKWKLAEQHGISESSVKRLLRQYRASA